jgi:ketosteroid isomerase-like protein
VPEEPLEIVRRGLDLLLESYERGAATDDLLEMCARGIRVDASRRVFNSALYEGRDGVERVVRDTMEAWEEFHFVTERLVEVGDRVLIVQTIAGRGRASTVDVKQKAAMIWTVRDGLVQLIEVFLDPREALDAVGVADQLGDGSENQSPELPRASQ